MPPSKRRQVDAAGADSVATADTIERGSIGASSNVSKGRAVAEREGQTITPLPLEVVSLIVENLGPVYKVRRSLPCHIYSKSGPRRQRELWKSEDLDLPNIEQGFRELLQALALVSPVWCRAAQAKLFHTIRIDGRESCQFWSRKFKHSPHLGKYVRFLHLSDPNDDCMGTPYLRTSPAKILVSTLTRLQSLSMHRIKQWGPVEQRLIKSFRSVTTLVVGRIWGMKGCRDIPDLVYAMPNVERLRLAVDGRDDNDLFSIYEAGAILGKRIPEDGIPPRQLRELQLYRAHLSMEYFSWLAGPSIDLSKLVNLFLAWREFPVSVKKDEFDFSSHDEFLRLTGGYTTTLKLLIPSPSNQAELGMSHVITVSNPQDFLTGHLISSRILNGFTALRTISICVKETDNFLPFLISTADCLLKTLAAPHSDLHRIKLTAGLYVGDRDQLRGSLAPEGCWQTLDELLSGDAFPVLSVVDLVVHAMGGLGRERVEQHGSMCFLVLNPNQEQLRGAIQACLPRTVSKDLLNLEIHDCDPRRGFRTTADALLA
ncbi:hypothetical protein Moror_11416 [Moniliophthora roreri MCA 2997]|uniref:Uncharacterized protein n=2 Tax=Moniliophthora roreri TaxID=221103 RepID=V2WUC6_MONRO|nr:hypothetical protein Moror_11416 [Moniliophthora roreri MCA 2997]KAI3619952.1 hypothetical protein WG66_002659 [Moniliophthora roreri]